MKRTALRCASNNGHADLVELILEGETAAKHPRDDAGRIWKSFESRQDIIGERRNRCEREKRGTRSHCSPRSIILANVVRLLNEEEGIDIAARDDLGRTRLIVASIWGCVGNAPGRIHRS